MLISKYKSAIDEKEIEFDNKPRKQNKLGIRRQNLKGDVRKVSSEQTSNEFSTLLLPDPRNPDDPPLCAQIGEFIEVELLRPRDVSLLGLLQKPLLHFLPPVGAGFALSPLVSETSSLSGAELLGGIVCGFKSRRDGQ